ncbi:hypothetical protein [Streptomyces sp. S.PNR 29]|uniref:hypothetical protein n=1 Tax=Streptomyces sp. S.PNR 29 TaxID=2973805 RepID=UPI0025AFDD3C|nr:hypothetical protein [Streptomyces sp. S.PNR 29]MDN0194994.1 hypothetical protein [Streptomyces sp. S.PNR 29]
MKLGKALATGVAEERPQTHEEVVPVTDEVPVAEEVQEPTAPVPAEVPAAR